MTKKLLQNKVLSLLALFLILCGGTQAAYTNSMRTAEENQEESESPASPIELNLTAGTDIATALDEAKAKVEKVGDITINLAEDGTYTISKTLEAPAGIIINGNADKPATIDASALEAPLITMSATPTVEVISDHARVGSVKIANVNVKGIKNSIFYDNNTKYCVVDFIIDNAVLALATEAVENEALISFKAGGAKDFTIKNSTVYGNAETAKYFIRYNNSARLDRYGFDKDTEFQTMTYLNNTFYKVIKADGQWGNYNGISGQKYSKFNVQNNIWVDSSTDIIRRMAGGRFSGSNPMEFAKNTYFVDGNDMSAKEANYDKSGTILITNPTFADAANGDFHIGASTQQAKEKTGDPRWLVDYVAEDITTAKELLDAEIKSATTLLGDADIETNEPAMTLKAAIDKAQSVYDTAEFNILINAATEELKAAEEAYRTATGISEITSGENADNGAWYNMQGVKTEKPTQKGIYIHNGKKIVIR